MSAKLRLVAYRPSLTSSTSDTTYDLDLQEHPSVSLNFQFSDIKEPETRKANYSQTFKLPFTNNNNEFFQNWFDVNLTTLVFSTKKKFSAVLYVGTVPQFEGVIQLKSVYQKAQLYEIVLMSNTADLFSAIGEQRLKDVFKLDDDTGYSEELDHVYNVANIKASWAGDNSSFQNIAGVSLRDTDVDVQKVMYPLSVTVSKFYFNTAVGKYLNMNPLAIIALGDEASNFIVPITQFRPAIQLKTLFKLIMAKAGFSYTSAFIDGDYFGKLFTTSCNHITLPAVPVTNSTGAVDGQMLVCNSTAWGNLDLPALGFDDCQMSNEILVPADTTTPGLNTYPIDTNDLWNTTYYYFTKEDINMTTVQCNFIVTASNITSCLPNQAIGINGRVNLFDTDTNTPTDTMVPYSISTSGVLLGDYTVVNSQPVILELDISNMEVGESGQIKIIAYGYKKDDPAATLQLSLGGVNAVSALGETMTWFNGNYNFIRIGWVGYGTNIYNQTVNVPACIDDSITQKAFLKDLIERFNLVILSDPNNASNLIIEPYNDYLSGSELKHWTDKLDLSKEIIVKDTTHLQKKKLLFTDLEDNDLWNKTIKERTPDINVYGKLEITETNNDFATGETKNNPIFSPYINEKVFVNNNDQLPTQLANMPVQYEYTYKEVNGGNETIIEATKPKLFYYNGIPSIVLNSFDNDSSTTYYLHRVSSSGVDIGDITAEPFTTYPLCTPFELSTTDGLTGLTTSTKSLYWNQAPPIAGQLWVFNYDASAVLGINSLYYLYWFEYLNSLYGDEARIMECYLNLNEVDIFNFKFNDEIFIKDSYWRIINIHNYQVGGTDSTKVTLLKVNDTYGGTCTNCDYVVGEILGSNTVDGFLLWCPADTPDCTPSLAAPDYLGIYAPPECCECMGGTVWDWATSQAANNLYPCLANTGSLPINQKTLFDVRSIFSGSQTKTFISGKIDGLDIPLLTGNNNNKFSTPLLPYFGDDIVIKYSSKMKTKPQLNGESHRIVLTGSTDADTRGYAYPEGNSNGQKLIVPIETNMIIRVKGIATVIGGKSTTYTLGSTEGFAYYTAFKNASGTITQLSTAGGTQEFSIREGVLATTCTLYITTSDGELQFGLDDSQTDTKRIWSLTADIDVNRVYNMNVGYAENWALYQNSRNIQFQNADYLIWN